MYVQHKILWRGAGHGRGRGSNMHSVETLTESLRVSSSVRQLTACDSSSLNKLLLFNFLFSC